MTAPDVLRPTRLEVAAGFVCGDAPEIGPLTDDVDGMPALEALRRAVLKPLSRPPCLVTFSGGRDSSAALAIAADTARREGLPLPVPVTLRFAGAPEADESEWQELVVRHLDLEDWHRIEITEELDVVGDYSTQVLRRHGVLYPPNAYSYVPLLEAATGGSLVTGIDGDGLFSGWRWRWAADVLAGRSRRGWRDASRVAYAAVPTVVKRAVERRRQDLQLTWLRDQARRECEDRWAAERAAEPLRWDQRCVWYGRRRGLAVARFCWDLLARDADVLLVHPQLDPRFVRALGRAGGRLGFGDRSAVMRALFAGLLPDEVLVRGTKAVFNQAFWRDGTREFVANWDGTGVDSELIDAELLRKAWAAPHNFTCMSPLQSALLATLGSEGHEAVRDLGQGGEVPRSGQLPGRQGGELEEGAGVGRGQLHGAHLTQAGQPLRGWDRA